jgi:molybdopterin molybdotransferase
MTDRFGVEERLMPLDEALAMLAQRVEPVAGVEQVALAQAAGRVLAADVVSSVTVPPHDNSAVDGYAVHFEDLATAGETRLPVTARIAAGHPAVGPVPRGAAARIFTGAPMPEGPDTVVMQEECRLEGETVVIAAHRLKPGANRRCRGEDIQAGATILSAGQRLRPQDVGVAAATGQATLEVRRPLRVAVFSTGDEVRDPPAPLAPGQIYDINRYTVSALLGGLGCVVTDLGILPDRVEVITARLRAAAADHDLLITSGGVSVGDEDHVKAAVQADGDLHFWRLAIKPGRPIALGEVGGTPFIGLPGNPVASIITFFLVARPVAFRLMGCRDIGAVRYPLPAAFSFSKKPGRREFLRGRLVPGPAVDKFASDGSGVLSSMTVSDGLLDIGEEVTEIAPGDRVWFLPFSEVL